MPVQSQQFTVKTNYPTIENQSEFEKRAAKAVARVIFDTLPPEKIDELIEAYRKLERSEKDG
jgi:hypothetical protein